MDLKELIAFRKELHAWPGLSGQEDETASRILRFIGAETADEVYSGVGGHGLLFVFEGKEKGPHTVFRADIDALPIQETGKHAYKSRIPGIAHLCGHDGHTAAMAGFARFLGKHRPEKGKIALLFQPAEETGQGALAVMENNHFKAFKTDYIFGFHNIPGYPKGQILLKNGSFAAASCGLNIELNGKTSHAAYPEAGLNPAVALAEIIQSWTGIASAQNDFLDMVLLTIVHARLGEKALGTSPAYGQIIATLRANRQDDMDKLTEKALNTALEIAKRHKLEVNYGMEEPFPATINHDDAMKVLKDAVQESGLDHEYLMEAFRWSEDFGVYTKSISGAFFGIGSGQNHPVLHNPDYDFPDDILTTAIELYKSIALITNNLR